MDLVALWLSIFTIIANCGRWLLRWWVDRGMGDAFMPLEEITPTEGRTAGAFVWFFIGI